MKFRVDGPTADELATLQQNNVCAVPTHLALEVQRQFCDLFGGKDFSKQFSSSSVKIFLPRRACTRKPQEVLLIVGDLVNCSCQL